MKQFKIEEITAQVALVRVLAETILLFSKIWDDVSGYNFTIMPEEDNTIKKDGAITFNMVFTLRPAY